MNLSKVDLNLFIVFDAIYTEANLTRAGQIVGAYRFRKVAFSTPRKQSRPTASA
jgi:hypothetical protein